MVTMDGHRKRWFLVLALAACRPVSVLGPPGDSEPSAGDTAEQVGSACDENSYPKLVINELMSANLHTLEDSEGDTPDWIELANLDEVTVTIEGWALGDDGQRWQLPARQLQPGELLLLFASGDDSSSGELHTSFSLAAEGEQVTLSAADGCSVDRVDPGRLYGDISYGRPAAEPDSWGYFVEPTPGEANSSESRPGFAATPTLSPGPGFYDTAVTITASSEDAAATLRITTDGAAPDEASELYDGPFSMTTGTPLSVVRARAWVDGLWPSRVASASYSQDPAILEDDLAVVSLVVDPFDLYDEQTGIYVYGPEDYYQYYPYFGANFWEDWERDAHMEIFEPDGGVVIDQDVGVKIHGGYTQAFEQKSFRILARSAYGLDSLDYKFFPYEELDSFKIMILEGAGDWCPAHTENAFVDRVFRDADNVRFPTIQTQAWEPCVVYLNGQFWGLYAFREKQDEHYVQAHFGADPDTLDRIECTADGSDDWWRVNQGDWEAFDEFNAFFSSNDLSDPEAWEQFKAMADIENLATAIIAEGYWGNSDWWYNNLRLWRERTDDAQWHWMVFDLGHGWPSYGYDHFGTSVSWSGSGMPLANALQNEEFRVLLANQASDFLNTNLAVGPALERLDEMHARIEPVMEEQYAAWCGYPVSSWYSDVATARTWAQQRPAYLWSQVQAHLRLDGTAQLSLEAHPPDSGSFKLTVVEVDPPFTGTFWTGIPISVTAQAEEGYEFAGWSDGSLGDEASVSFTLAGDRSLTASFE